MTQEKNPAEPIYVGRGKGNRYKHHINGASNRHFRNKLKKINEAGLVPIIEFAKENLDINEANQLEIELIAKFGRFDLGLGPLCNWTNGGDGTDGYKHSDETKKLFSEQRKGKSQTEAQYKANCSRVISNETKKKQSIANKGHARHTPEQLKILKEYNSNRVITQEMRDNFSKARLGNTPTKINYPPLEELITLVENQGLNKTAIQLNVNYSSVNKYLKRRGYNYSKRHNHQSFHQD